MSAWLQGASVTPDRHAVHEMGSSNYPMYIKAFHDHQVKVTTDLRLKSLSNEGNRVEAHFKSGFWWSSI